MTEARNDDPLVPRPASTVMLVRERQSIEVFLMRRHSAMDFVAGVMVFPGGGVDQRDRGTDIPWYGPEPTWWAERLDVDADLAGALVCAAARETFEESGVLFAGAADDSDVLVDDASVYRDQRAALANNSLSFADFLRDEKLMLRADLLRPWANWVTPKEERTRRYDTYFAEGQSCRLPPTWTQLDSLAGHTVEEVLAVERKIVAVEPHLAADKDTGNWEIEFFNSERYNAARNRRAPQGYGPGASS
jgi:hypothetical protein